MKTKRRPKTITIRLTEAEAEGLMNAGNRGIVDLQADQSDEAQDAAAAADLALSKLGRAMAMAWSDAD